MTYAGRHAIHAPHDSRYAAQRGIQMLQPKTRRDTGSVGAACAAVSIAIAAAAAAACAWPVLAATVQEARLPARAIKLLAGAQQEVRLGQPLERVAVGNPAVADALLLKNGTGPASVLVVARSPGVTDLMIWPRGGAPVRYAVEVAAVAPDADAPSVTSSAAGVSIDGQSPDALVAARAQAAARATQGGREGKDGKGGGVVVDRSVVPLSATVQVDVKVVEVSKSVLKEVGLNFFRANGGFSFGTFSPSSLNKFTAGSFSSGSSSSGSGSASVDSGLPIGNAFNLVAASVSHGIFANISVLESNGLARVLAEPSLVALSGQSASFLAGGEIPIPVPQALGTTTIQFKPFGIGLTVTPTVLAANRIALKVAPEASDLDFTRSVSINGASVPAIITRRADTTIELGDGESFVIGGLVNRNTVSSVSKVPVLGDLPIIGAFFKNLNYTQDERELVIMVSPRLVKPLAKGSAAAASVGNDGRTSADPNVWGWYMLGEYADPTLPGFSK